MAKEHDIQNAVLLECGALPWVRLWRQNVGVARTLDGHRVVRFGLPGAADLTGLFAGCGVRCEVEIKGPGGRVRKDQKLFGEAITRMGGFYMVGRSVAEVRAELDKHLEGCHRCQATMSKLEA